MNKHKTLISLLCVMLYAAVCYAAGNPGTDTPTPTPNPTVTPAPTPSWLQYSEKAVGEGHSSLADTINRPTKEIWQRFTEDHTINGYHKDVIHVGTLILRDNAGQLEYSLDNGNSWLIVQVTPAPTPTPTPEPTVPPEPTETPTPEPTVTP